MEIVVNTNMNSALGCLSYCQVPLFFQFFAGKIFSTIKIARKIICLDADAKPLLLTQKYIMSHIIE